MLLTKYLIRLILLNLTLAQLFCKAHGINHEQWFTEWINRIQMEQNFENILILRHKTEDCFLENLANILKQPKWIYTDNNIFELKQKFNSEILTVLCVQKEYNPVLLVSLAKILNNCRHTRIILLAKDFSLPQDLYQPLINFCEQNQFTNVIILFDKLLEEKQFYRLTPYPEYKAIIQTFGNSTKIFPKHWTNFHGKVLHTLPDQLEPRSVMYIDQKGHLKLTGYVAKFIQLYAEKYNATLEYLFPINIGQIIHFFTIQKYTENRSLDLPISLTAIATVQSYYERSYPIELNSLLTMVPTKDLMPTADIYLMVIDKKLIIAILFMIFSFSMLFVIIDSKITLNSGKTQNIRYINLILNDKVVPGILGQTYILHNRPKPAHIYLYISIFILGLTLNTIYAAHLKTLITSHPVLPEIKSFNDLRKIGLYILFDETDVKLLDTLRPKFLDQIRDLIKVTDTSTFQNERKKFNISYAYNVPAPTWTIFEEQQRFFARKMFYTPKAMKLCEMYHMTVPLQKNSVLKEPFDLYIHHIHAAGLLNHWYTKTFQDMVSAKKISLTDHTKVNVFNYLKAGDLKWVWIFIGSGYVLSSITLLVELCVNIKKSKPRKL